MKSLADGLPPEVAAQIHPDWRKNEQEYWENREAIRAQFDGLWVAYSDGKVIASGRRSVEVLHAANVRDSHAFFIRVGAESEGIRIRRTTFAYDSAYLPEPLPVVTVEFRPNAGTSGITLDRVIPDTGADASLISWADSQALGFDPKSGKPGIVIGVGGQSNTTLSFDAWAVVDGVEHTCQIQVDFGGDERLIGRDVLNQMDVLFRGPAREVVFNP